MIGTSRIITFAVPINVWRLINAHPTRVQPTVPKTEVRTVLRLTVSPKMCQ